MIVMETKIKCYLWPSCWHPHGALRAPGRRTSTAEALWWDELLCWRAGEKWVWLEHLVGREIAGRADKA